jgi:hypothetical protein
MGSRFRSTALFNLVRPINNLVARNHLVIHQEGVAVDLSVSANYDTVGYLGVLTNACKPKDLRFVCDPGILPYFCPSPYLGAATDLSVTRDPRVTTDLGTTKHPGSADDRSVAEDLGISEYGRGGKYKG